ncbi:MAG: carboxymuconolactone decarboxylase family protein [Deltaproteobacteria bacterium]|nr:carboxymuconolactone decarboxylase family protein [Deltaproteobacteria bacterium]
MRKSNAVKRTNRVPKTYGTFVERFPEVGKAWELLRKAESAGRLPEKTVRLLKLAIAIGGMREGAVHSSVRKAREAGATRAEIEQVVVLAASTIGLPSTVAIYSWVSEQLDAK